MALLNGCPQCGTALRAGHFDATFRTAAGGHKLARGITGAYCPRDEFLALAAEELAQLGLTGLAVISVVLDQRRTIG